MLFRKPLKLVVFDWPANNPDVAMVPNCAIVFLALLAFVAATDVRQCSGKSVEGLKDLIQLTPCPKVPCKLKKGTDQEISITFTPDKDLNDLKNKVSANLGGGIELPFIGVDSTSVCDKTFTESGEKASCPLKKGNKYVYKDSFPIHDFYPKISVIVKWALEDIICFEVPAKIV